MTPDPELLRAYERETQPGEGRVDRLATALLRRRARVSRPRALAPLLVGTVVLGVVAALVRPWGSAPPAPEAVATPSTIPSETPSTTLSTTPTLLAPGPLESPDAPAVATAPGGIALTYQGSGRLGRSVVTWDAGTLHVEVPAGKGLAFAVRTREGEARVVGTGFTVTRGELGTEVDVQHGGVAVTCAGEPERTVGPGERHTCAPVSAPGLLARARALVHRDAPPDQVLATIDRGLALAAPDDAAARELRYLRAEVSYQAGRSADARTDLDAYLAAGPGPRDPDALRLAAALAVEAGDCATARAPLEALVAAGPVAADLVWLAECVAADDPDRARRAFTQALASDPDPASSARAHAGIARLGTPK